MPTDRETTRTPREAWEEHNRSFRYEPPDDPPELWSQEDHTELWDRVITDNRGWECQKCSKPFRNLRTARRHVENRHGEKLIKKATNR